MGIIETLHSMDPFKATILYGGVLLYLGFLLGKKYFKFKRHLIIEQTIDHLMDNGFLKTYKNEKNELIIIPYNEDFPQK